MAATVVPLPGIAPTTRSEIPSSSSSSSSYLRSFETRKILISSFFFSFFFFFFSLVEERSIEIEDPSSPSLDFRRTRSLSFLLSFFPLFLSLPPSRFHASPRLTNKPTNGGAERASEQISFAAWCQNQDYDSESGINLKFKRISTFGGALGLASPPPRPNSTGTNHR